MSNIFNRFEKTQANLNRQRSTFNNSHTYSTSCNLGDLIPFDCKEVLPGDTIKVNTSAVIRMSPLARASFDTMNADIYYFFVPYRLIWDDWKSFQGENKESAWANKTEYTIPQCSADDNCIAIKGSLGDYLGLPTYDQGEIDDTTKINHLPFRAYALIWDEWFRDQNITQPTEIYKGSNETTIQPGETFLDNTGHYNPTCFIHGGEVGKAAKYHDYFTSCLPAPLKSLKPIYVPIGNNAPVITESYTHNVKGANPMTFGSTTIGGTINTKTALQINSDIQGTVIQTGLSMNPNGTTTTSAGPGVEIVPNNLYADLSQAQGATVNQLRLAFQLQKILETDARGGTRYTEILKTHWGITSSDARLQRPEYLGGKRTPIQIQQVNQVSWTNPAEGQSALGESVGQSQTADNGYSYKYSAEEHGFIMGLMCIRLNHNYSGGLDKIWTRKTRYDFYMPELANIGEQPVYKRELKFTGNDIYDNEVLGYQEAWAEYRFTPNKVTGALRPIEGGEKGASYLANWTTTDVYDNKVGLNDAFIYENKHYLDPIMMYQDTDTFKAPDQFIINIYIDETDTREMPLYSIPGLIDHN